jgi:hypothetical protein
MPRTSTTQKAATFTFRLDPGEKAALTRSAKEEHLHPAELLRALVRDHLAERERRAFEAEARRQSQAIARRARDAIGDEAQVMGELEAELDRGEAADEWKP